MKKPKTKPAAKAAPAELRRREYELNQAKVAAELDIVDLDDTERAFLAVCQRIYGRHSGCNSPFENFFYSLVLRIELGGSWPTPEVVADELETFKKEFEDMHGDAVAFFETYPDAEKTKEAANA